MTSKQALCEGLAATFEAGTWSPKGLAARATAALGLASTPPWLRALARLVVRGFPRGAPRESGLLAALIAGHRGFLLAHGEAMPSLVLRTYPLASPAMRPAPGAPSRWSAPPLPTAGDLAAWLGLSMGELLWFAATERHEGRPATRPLSHYDYRWIEKPSGGARLLEAPRPRLRALQRRILHGILDQVPTHAAAHGFVRGRSVLTSARAHLGSALVLQLDLREFFPSVRASRVHALFRTLGYPELVARLLTGLTTHATPGPELARAPAPRTADEIPIRWAAARSYRVAHLPQGAPTSPALANLAAFRLDRRLDAAARVYGARYTRYADDLAFSGGDDFAGQGPSFCRLAQRITADEGFAVRADKTRFQPRAARQLVAGVVVNQHPNVPRPEYDRLKALLHNARRFGAASQNREGHADFRAHVAGRVGWVQTLNPARGQKLRAAMAAIDWES